MAGPDTRSARRSDALSRERIVAAAVDLLDAGGEDELTVRGLTAHLATGRGAIYHHVHGKDELLADATDHVVGQVLAAVPTDGPPDQALRSLALGIFDAIDAHPWVAARLSRDPTQVAVLRIWKIIGTQLQRLGVAPATVPDAGSALVSYVLGSTAQYAAGPRTVRSEPDREAYLERLAKIWTEHDDDPLVADAALHVRQHDDREQFLAGVEIFLRGVG